MTDHDKPEALRQLRELAMAATPGPWKADHNSIFRYVSHRDWSPVLHAQYEYDTGVTIEVSDANADYIAAANPTTILRLLDTLAAKDAEIEAMREALDGAVSAIAVNDRREVAMLFDTPEQANAFVRWVDTRMER